MYLIHPAWFYIYGVVGQIGGLVLFVAIVSLICAAVYRLCSIDMGAERAEKTIKSARKFLYLSMFCGVLAALTPSKETMLQMAVASYATSENITKLAVNGKILKDELKSDFLDIIKTIKAKDETKEKKEE